MNELERPISLLRRRIRYILIERHGFAFGAVGAGAAIIYALLALKIEALDRPWIAWTIVAAGVLAGVIYGAQRKLTPFAVARAAEKRLELKERVSSSVRLYDASQQDEMVDALLADAANHLQNVDPKQVFPHKFSRGSLAFACLLAFLVGVIYAPLMPALQTPQRREEARTMKQEGKKLVKLAKDLQKAGTRKNQDVMKQIARNMQALGKKMQSGRMSKKQAMLATQKLTKQVEQAQKKLAAQNMAKATKTAEEAAKQFQEMGKAMDPETAKQMEAMKNRLDELSKLAQNGKMSPEQMKEFEKLSQKLSEMKSATAMSPEMLKKLSDMLASGEYEKAMQSLEDLAQKLREGKMSKAEMKKLAKELKALAEALKGSPLEQVNPELMEAAKALEKGDGKTAAEMLELAAMKGAEIGKELKALQELAKAGAG